MCVCVCENSKHIFTGSHRRQVPVEFSDGMIGVVIHRHLQQSYPCRQCRPTSITNAKIMSIYLINIVLCNTKPWTLLYMYTSSIKPWSKRSFQEQYVPVFPHGILQRSHSQAIEQDKEQLRRRQRKMPWCLWWTLVWFFLFFWTGNSDMKW